MPKFSIIIPCFNAETTLPETLESLRAQTFTDWEAICVDDGSTDATLEQLRRAQMTDPRIKPVRNSGKGPSAARNHGALTLATGDFIAFCDADDLWEPTKLAELAGAFFDKQVDGIFGQVAFFETNPAEASAFSTVPDGALSIPVLLGENPVCTMSNLTLRRSVFVASSGFDAEMVHNEDLEWLIRLVGTGARVVGVPWLQTRYRNSSGGLSANHAEMRRGRERALATARQFGVIPGKASHAIHYRHLARRALRSGAGRFDALRFAIAGLCQSPRGFLSPMRRGGLTLLGALCAVVLPRALSTSLFS